MTSLVPTVSKQIASTEGHAGLGDRKTMTPVLDTRDSELIVLTPQRDTREPSDVFTFLQGDTRGQWVNLHGVKTACVLIVLYSILPAGMFV